MTEDPKPRTLTINLIPRARAIIDGIREDTGVPNTEAMARLLEWFADQDRKLRVAIITRDEDLQRELARLVLTDMAAMQEAHPDMAQAVPLTIEQATRIIRTMADHIERLSMGRGTVEAAKRRKK